MIYVDALNAPGERFFESIKEFKDQVKQEKETIFHGIYDIMQDIFLYSSDTEDHRLLDFHISDFFRTQDLFYPQNNLLYYNISGKPGLNLLTTKIPDIYVSNFAGENLKTFGTYYLPKHQENRLLDNLR